MKKRTKIKISNFIQVVIGIIFGLIGLLTFLVMSINMIKAF